ncbi:SDR family oxidoreductase [Leucobacter weissii]|uniref:SDR family oxidoreductase n=1 Tax=Leucobacter weissii TaxID=1983706 RepID=A0A939MKC0_9MICO|nr:SDR family NAD(P)-dependent oxidoreductase [Leucobacter weissii]MBO1901545.1 SDR family oxidoreductase [Leucobacter weissii]
MSEQRVVLVTGAGGGMGREVSARYAANGDRLVLVDLTRESLDRAAEEVRATWPELDLLLVPADVSQPESVRDLAEQVREWAGRVDVLALVAGVLQQANRVTEIEIEEWDFVNNVNVRGVFLMAKHFVPLMPKGGGSSIVTIASWYGHSGHGYFAAYCASKAGVISLTQSLADELAEDRIRVNAVCPGNIDTQMHRNALQAEADARGIAFEEMRDIEWAKIPLGIAGPPGSIADAVEFLSSEKASYITGASIDVNGGVLFR